MIISDASVHAERINEGNPIQQMQTIQNISWLIMKSPSSILTLGILAQITLSAAKAPSAPTTASTSGSTKPLHFSSPLQTYTLFDKPALSSPENRPPRSKFLPRFRVGLMAEKRARDKILDEQRRGVFSADIDEDDLGFGGDSWAEHSALAEERRNKAVEARVEKAHDEAVAQYDERVAARMAARAVGGASNSGEYQFVGVVNDGKSSSEKVTWYARKKPKNSKWSLRLVHVNRDAVLRDLFVKGKVDVFGKYVNEGLDKSSFVVDEETGEQREVGMKPLIKANYCVKERSWRTLWNFHPKRILTTSSGSFWRERRISPGLYTDGTTVYESVYRYRDGKNGMKAVAKLDKFLTNPTLGVETKMRLVERLKGGDSPDVVVEK